MAFHKVAYDRITFYRLRDMDFKYRTGSINALYQYPAVHHFYQLFGKIQSKARSFNIPIAIQVNAFKALEQ